MRAVVAHDPSTSVSGVQRVAVDLGLREPGEELADLRLPGAARSAAINSWLRANQRAMTNGHQLGLQEDAPALGSSLLVDLDDCREYR